MGSVVVCFDFVFYVLWEDCLCVDVLFEVIIIVLNVIRKGINISISVWMLIKIL